MTKKKRQGAIWRTIIIVELLFSMQLVCFCVFTPENLWVILGILQLFALITIGLIIHFVIDPVIETMRQNKKASERDALTGLYNRNRFNKKVDFYNNECDSIAVIFADVNNLKNTNDLYGHVAGDELICSIADSIKELGIDNMAGYRFGGDEFVLVISNVTNQEAKVILADFLENIKSKTLDLSPLTPSIAYGLEYEESEIDIESVLKKADANMYRCKKNQKKN